jgi:hypothetical protein
VTLPLMISEKDEELLGVANRSDPMGMLAVWSVRARDLVPHLTEQTTNVRGFQILVEAFRLWESYEPAHPEHAGRLDDFFLLVEQAFARTVAWHDGDWPLPGSRRVNARAYEEPHISIADPDWHLLGGQKANGLWGLYRGASRRAGLLLDDMTRLSGATMEQAMLCSVLGPTAQERLFKLVKQAMDGATVALPTHQKNQLTRGLYDTFHDVPLADHLRATLVDGHALNLKLAERLVSLDALDRRRFLTEAARDLDDHRLALEDTIRCENLLAVVEAVFLWLCASKGQTLEAAVAEIPVDLAALAAARTEFGSSGVYQGDTARARHARFHEHLDTSSNVALARSVLLLHQEVSDERGRAAWIWEENSVLHSDVDFARPLDADLQVGLAWRNDYYLYPLMSIAQQLAEVRA